jgi:hypothetical protein
MAFAQLNGQLNLASAEEVFRTVSAISAHTVTRIPDGETGRRQDRRAARVEALGRTAGLAAGREGLFRLDRGVRPEDIELPELGLSAVARESYALFTHLRGAEAIMPDTRFQVSLPWPTALDPLVSEPDREAVADALARRLHHEAEALAVAIPARDLAVHWDVPRSTPGHMLDDVSRWLPADVPYGFHICDCGDGERPEDLSGAVAVANALTARAERPAAWLSLPVPAERDDPPFYDPIRGLVLAPGTALYLGLVHQDGLQATQRRIDAAKHVVQGFGVSTECGLGGIPRDTVLKLLWLQLGARV